MNSKGISPIVSSVLVLAVAISVMGIYANWAPDFAGDLAGEFSNQSDQRIKCSNAGIAVRNAVYDKTGRQVEFEVENTGTIRFNTEVFTAAVNNSQVIGRNTFTGLDVEETQTLLIETDRIPGQLIASTNDCPEVRVEQDFIQVVK